MTVDVVVADRQNRPVAGLTAAHFSVREDGVPQEISSFEAVEVPAEPAWSRPTRAPVSTNVGRAAAARTGRSLALGLDNLHLDLFQAERARIALERFLRRGVREGDHVILASTGGEIWWTTRVEGPADELLGLLDHVEGRFLPGRGLDFMSDFEAMQIWVRNDPTIRDAVARRFVRNGVANRESPDLYVRARAIETYRQAVARNRGALETLQRVLGALQTARGRKSLILLSAGLLHDPTLEGFEEVTQAAQRANVAIYFVDTRGLTGLPTHMSPEFLDVGTTDELQWSDAIERFRAADGSESLALDSGGFIINDTNDLAQGIERIAGESRVYYLLGYQPTNTARDGKYRTVDVELTFPLRDDFDVRARRGYHAPPGDEADAEKAQTSPERWYEQPLDSPFEQQDLPLRTASYVFEATPARRARVLVVTEVDIRQLAFRDEAGRSLDNLDMQLLVGQLETGVLTRYDASADLALLLDTRKLFEATWFPVRLELELPPGRHHAKVAVRERNAGIIGSVVHTIDVPELSGLRTSSLVLSDIVEADAETGAGPSAPRILARRVFAPGTELLVHFDVYGAATEQTTGRPRVRTGLEMRRGDGTLLGRGQLSPMNPLADGRLTRTSSVRLTGTQPGDYELALYVTDEAAGKTIIVREPFTVADPEEADP